MLRCAPASNAALCCVAQGVSENIMLGQLCPVGTGAFSLLLDEKKLADAHDLDLTTGFDPMDYGALGLTPGRTPGGSLRPRLGTRSRGAAQGHLRRRLRPVPDPLPRRLGLGLRDGPLRPPLHLLMLSQAAAHSAAGRVLL
jgi:hypothetical protein